MVAQAVAQETIRALRRDIARIEGVPSEWLAPAQSAPERTVLRHHGRALHCDGSFLETGIERLDQTLGGGLPRAALTEIHSHETRNAAAAAGFGLCLASLILKATGKDRPLLWIGTSEIFREAGFPYAPAFSAGFGIPPEALLFSSAPKLADALWVAEEAARLAVLSAVFLELRGNPTRLDLTATRRLHRRAQEAGRPVFLIRQAAITEPTAAPFRLAVAAAPASPRLTQAGPLPDAIGLPAFSVSISKSRTAPAGTFIVEWNSHDLTLQERLPQDSRRLVSLSRAGKGPAPAPGGLLAFPQAGVSPAGSEPSRREHATGGSSR